MNDALGPDPRAPAGSPPEAVRADGADASGSVGPPEPGRRRGGFLGELPILVLIAFGLALLLKTFLVQAFFIPSSSMEPTLLEHDRVLVNKLVYRFREPARGEVVVFTKRDEVPALEPVEPTSPPAA
jgi:signal peptidase I